MHSGNCAAKDRVRFPCGRAKPPGPRFLVAGHLECFYPTIECAGGVAYWYCNQRARITRGPGVNIEACDVVETRVVQECLTDVALYLS